MKNEQRIIYIPQNFKEGASIGGIMVKPLYIIQAIPLIGLLVLLIFTVGAGMSTVAKLLVFILVGGPILIIAAIGINGDSVIGFLIKAIKSKKKTRICLYNPRIKTEIKSLRDDPLSVQQLPREKLLAFIEKSKSGKINTNYYDEIDFDNIVFEDDEELRQKLEEEG